MAQMQACNCIIKVFSKSLLSCTCAHNCPPFSREWVLKRLTSWGLSVCPFYGQLFSWKKNCHINWLFFLKVCNLFWKKNKSNTPNPPPWRQRHKDIVGHVCNHKINLWSWKHGTTHNIIEFHVPSHFCYYYMRCHVS